MKKPAKTPAVKCSYQKMIPIGQLKPHPDNPNKHPERQVELIANIIKYTGWRHPIVVSRLSGCIVAGHARLQAAKKLGLKLVPVDFQAFKNREEEYAFLTADNASQDLAVLDLEDVKLKIEELNIKLDPELLGLVDFDVDLTEKIEGKYTGKSIGELTEGFENSTIRQIVLIIEQEDYDSVMRRFLDLQQEFNVTSNTLVVLKLMEHYEKTRPRAERARSSEVQP
jgi:hypothetical protein